MSDLDQQIRARLDEGAAWYDEAQAERAESFAGAIRAVLDLHRPHEWIEGHFSCDTCAKPDQSDTRQDYPCETVQAIATQLGLTQETTP